MMDNEEKNNSSNVVKNILIVGLSNVLILLSGILVGFVVPKIMGDTNYGFYKVYTLYLSYVGLFHFGFIDGMFVIYSGNKYEKLNYNYFRFFTRFIICVETVIALIISLVSLFFLKSNYGYVFLFVGISLLATNVAKYYQFISQMTGRFKELSIRNTIQACLQAVSVIVFFILVYFGVISQLSFKIYILVYSLILIILAIWYIVTYRKILLGKVIYNEEVRNDIKKFFIIGFPLMIANIISSLILTFDRQFVSILVNFNKYTIEEYGVYSFAYTMLALISTLIAAISTVLYPTIKSFSHERLKNDYNKLICIIAIVTSASLLTYQPLCFIVERWLPNYIDSLNIFRIILPGIILSSCITMIMFNYYKTLGKHVLFFVQSLVILVLSIVANLIAVFIGDKLEYISGASIIVMIIWYFITNYFIAKKLELNTFKNTTYIAIIICSFYFITYFISNVFISFAVYLFVYFVISLMFYKNEILNRFKQ